MTLVDSNVLLDLLNDEPEWADWSEAALLSALKNGPLYINTIGYAELVPAFDDVTQLDSFLRKSQIVLKDISRATSWLAGEVFLVYRRRKGTKTGVLADFFIGAQAQTENWAVLTRDGARYKTYFPKVRLITPKST